MCANADLSEPQELLEQGFYADLECPECGETWKQPGTVGDVCKWIMDHVHGKSDERIAQIQREAAYKIHRARELVKAMEGAWGSDFATDGEEAARKELYELLDLKADWEEA